METFQRRFSILKRKPGGEKRNGLNLPEQKAIVHFRFYEELNEYLTVAKCKKRFTHF